MFRDTVIGKGVLLTLRGINLNSGADYEDMVSLRIWAEEHRIITTRKRKLLSVTNLKSQLERGCGPVSASHFIITNTDLLTSHIEEALERIEGRTSELEEQIISLHDGTLRTQISAIRRDAIILRRYLVPQREAITRMQVNSVSWFTEKVKRQLHEIANSLILLVETLDSIGDRASVAREELTNALSAHLNSRIGGINIDKYYPVLGTFAASHHDLVTTVINRSKGQVCDLLNPQPATQHQHKHCQVTFFSD